MCDNLGSHDATRRVLNGVIETYATCPCSRMLRHESDGDAKTDRRDIMKIFWREDAYYGGIVDSRNMVLVPS